MEDASETRNETYAAASVVWMLGWALVLPFAHSRRLLSYGFFPAVLLIGASILFPSASLFAPILVSPNFTPRPLPDLAPLGSVQGWIVLLLTFVITAALLCIWQRDILRRFRDPLGQLLRESAARMTEFLSVMLVWAACLGCVFIWTGSVTLAVIAAVVTSCFARILLLVTLLAGQGWRAALRCVLNFSAGRIYGSLLMLAILGLLWLGLTALGDSVAIRAALRTNDPRTLLFADIFNVVVSLLALLWLTAMPALMARVSLKPESTADACVFD